MVHAVSFKENLVTMQDFCIIDDSVHTVIWNTKRKVWMKGPDLKTEYRFFRAFPSVINSTTIVIIARLDTTFGKFVFRFW